MDMILKNEFSTRWAKYFADAPLPICFFYSDDDAWKEHLPQAAGSHACMVCQLIQVRRGRTLAFDAESIRCGGGKRYCGFETALRPGFEHFLSCGIPGKIEGERYKKTPELVLEFLKGAPEFTAPGKYIVFKRWDELGEADEPAVAAFFNTPDVIAGLYTLSGFDAADPNAVIAPFGAGCATIVQHPYLEKDKPEPRSVLGMFDVSARPCVDAATFTFATPMTKLKTMIANMDESFLITPSWAKVCRRIDKGQ